MNSRTVLRISHNHLTRNESLMLVDAEESMAGSVSRSVRTIEQVNRLIRGFTRHTCVVLSNSAKQIDTLLPGRRDASS
jgi:hypothetical protein